MYKVAIITVSDKGYRGEREDLSGPEIRRIVEAHGYEVSYTAMLPDDRAMLRDTLARLADTRVAQLILTTGGTGFSPRDTTPEASLDVAERLCPGIPEAMRSQSMAITPKVMLSRSVAVLRGESLIINLPGSAKAVRECLEGIIGPLAHGLDVLTGSSGNCAR